MAEIGNYAFQDNALEDLNVPDSITSSGSSAFVGNLDLPLVFLPSSNPTVGTDAFPIVTL